MSGASNIVVLPAARTPPHNLDAERSLLGGVLLDGHALADVELLVRPEDFYREVHRLTFEAMISLRLRSEPVDRVQVKAELTRLGKLEDVGGEEYLDLLDKFVPTAANLAYYAKIVADKALRRRTIEAAGIIAQIGYEGHGDEADLVDDAEARFFALRRMDAGKGFTHAKQLVAVAFKELEARAEHDTTLTGAPSGLDELDALTNGLQVGHLILLAARPSMGKSSLSRDVVRATCKAGGGAAIFSLEMPKDEITLAFLGAEARVDLNHIRTGQVRSPEWERLAVAAGRIADWELHIDDTARTLQEIRAHLRRLQLRLEDAAASAERAREKEPGVNVPPRLRLAVIDYLQLMDGTGKEDSREQVVAGISRQLKALAKELRIPILALSQLNRELERRPDKRPTMSDLRESGSLEQDADEILFIYRGVVYGDKEMGDGDADVIVSKQRMGPVGKARVAFVKEFSMFTNLQTHEQARQLRLDAPPPPTDDDRRD